MTELATIGWLAARELWISFRLLVALALLILAALLAAMLPPSAPGDPASRYAASAGTAVWLVAALAAGTFAAERARGSAGWVVARGVRRSTLLAAWFGVFALILLVAVPPGALLAWLMLVGVGAATAPAYFTLSVTASLAGAAAAVAAGLLAGALLPRGAAAGAALLFGACCAAVALAAPDLAVLLPVGGNVLLAGSLDAGRDLGPPIRSLGASLAGAGLLLGVARFAFERSEL